MRVQQPRQAEQRRLLFSAEYRSDRVRCFERTIASIFRIEEKVNNTQQIQTWRLFFFFGLFLVSLRNTWRYNTVTVVTSSNPAEPKLPVNSLWNNIRYIIQKWDTKNHRIGNLAAMKLVTNANTILPQERVDLLVQKPRIVPVYNHLSNCRSMEK
jgi:hypothetical protein